MVNYEQLYHLMVNASEDALAAMEQQNYGTAREILIAAECRAEELYIRAEDSAAGEISTPIRFRVEVLPAISE